MAPITTAGQHQAQGRDGGRDHRHHQIAAAQPAVLIDGGGRLGVIHAAPGADQQTTQQVSGLGGGGRFGGHPRFISLHEA